MIDDHQYRPDWCEMVFNGEEPSRRLTDFHHAHSRSQENIERFRILCEMVDQVASRRAKLTDACWEETKLPSPFWGIEYINVRSDKLQQLAFGKPEFVKPITNSSAEFFHPFW